MFAGCAPSSSMKFMPSRRKSAETSSACRWPGCKPSIPGCAAWPCLQPWPTPMPIASGLRRRGLVTSVRLVDGDPGAPPIITMLLPEGEIPWGGHSGRYAAAQVMAEIETHETTLVFCNTRGLAELYLPEIWASMTPKLPIGIHHGSLSISRRGARSRARWRGRLRALVCTASLDLGVDWGDVDCVIQMGAPKGSRGCCNGSAAPTTGSTSRARRCSFPATASNIWKRSGAIDAVAEGQRDGDASAPAGYDVLAQHVMACACAGHSTNGRSCSPRCARACPTRCAR
jgi:ATP-dependent Lhr-like helicase